MTPPRETEALAASSFRRNVTAARQADGAFSEPRYRLYRLCSCSVCEASGKVRTSDIRVTWERCSACRGEGSVRELLAEANDEAGVGMAIITLGREGELADCPVGLLDTQGEVGQKWIISPWLPSARNVSDAGRTLGRARKGRA